MRQQTTYSTFLRQIISAVVIILTAVCVSCGHSEHSKVQNTYTIQTLLDKAESMLGTNDSVALATLDSIDATAIRSRKQNARYALLYSEALYKNYIPAMSDSLIMIAVRYYSVGNHTKQLFRAFYQLGCIYNEQGQLNDAAVALTQAELLVDRIDDDYRSGLLYTQLGNVFFSSFDFYRAEQYYRLAHDKYESAGMDRHKTHALYDVAGCLLQQKQYVSAHSIFVEVQNWASTNEDTDLERICLLGRLICSIQLHDNDMATAEMDEYVSLCRQPIESPHIISVIVSYYLSTGRYSDAVHKIEEGWSHASTNNDSINLWYEESLLYELQGMPDSALVKFKHSIRLQNENLYSILNQPVLGAQKDYYRNLAENEMLKVSHNRTVVLFLIIFVLLAFTLLYIMHRAHKVKNEKERQDYLLTIKELRLKEDTNSDIINQLNKKVNTLFGKQYAELDRVFDTMMKIEAEEETKSANHKKDTDNASSHTETADKLYSHIKSKLEELGQKKNQSKIDTIIDTTLNNLMERIKDSRFKMADEEINILRFSLIGFSVKTINKITGLTPKYIYQKRDRAIEKIGRISSETQKELVNLLK